MKRNLLAWIVNWVAPGGGLIVLRREWLGLALVVLFVVFGQVAILGRWVIPLDIPGWVTLVAGVCAVMIWVQAQWMLHRLVRLNASPVLADELADLRRRAALTLSRGEHSEAERVLLVALSIHDEDVEVVMLWAQLMVAQGKREAARRAWRRVLVLSSLSTHREAARQALASL